MTVAAELAKTGQRLEYFLTIEGVGWMTDESTLASGFDGVVFATNDINGDLATKLGCTVYHGLELPSGISETIDPRTATFSVGGLTAKILDVNDWWLSNYTPRKTGNSTTLVSSVNHNGVEIHLTDGTQFADGETAWIGGREAVLLAGKTNIAGTEYHYDVTRGYLGTPIGSALRQPESNRWTQWAAATTVSDVMRVWFNRRVWLWAHVPGESVSNCLLLWVGKLRGVAVPECGITYELSCVGDFMDDTCRIWRPMEWNVYAETIVGSPDRSYGPAGPGGYGGVNESEGDYDANAAQAFGARRVLFLDRDTEPDNGLASDGYTGKYALANFYQWRTEPGGAAGMVSTWSPVHPSGDVQAMTARGITDIIGEYCKVGNDILFCFGRYLGDISDNDDPRRIVTEVISRVGTSSVDVAQKWGGLMAATLGSKIRFLLSNQSPFKEFNRFTVNNIVCKNVIDILLIFLTSFDFEFWKADATGGTATVPTFAAGSVGPADHWIGKALHCVEGSNKGEARLITDNDADSITVESAFTNAPAAGTEYQIRNSIYDVLPGGWGLGVDSSKIDISQIEEIRDTYLSHALVSEFILGTDDEIDIWQFLHENICQPYGILLYFNRTTRKISARYMGCAIGDGIVDDYITIEREDIVGIGSLQHQFSNPVGMIKLEIRAENQKVVGVIPSDPNWNSSSNYYSGITWQKRSVPELFGGGIQTIIIKGTDLEAAYDEHLLSSLGIKALFNSKDTCHEVVMRLTGLLGLYASPPPVWSGAEIDMELYSTMHAGSWATINWADAPVNPFTGTRGWTSVVGRVIQMNLDLSERPTFQVSIELFTTYASRLIAPAAIVSSKSSDVNGDYFVVQDTNYVADPDNDKDWYYFGVDDRIELRSSSGAYKEGPEVIKAFGTNQSTDPEDADTSRIYIDGTIASAIVAGDYITFSASTSADTANMDFYSVYGDAVGTVTDGFTRYYG